MVDKCPSDSFERDAAALADVATGSERPAKCASDSAVAIGSSVESGTEAITFAVDVVFALK